MMMDEALMDYIHVTSERKTLRDNTVVVTEMFESPWWHAKEVAFISFPEK